MWGIVNVNNQEKNGTNIHTALVDVKESIVQIKSFIMKKIVNANVWEDEHVDKTKNGMKKSVNVKR